MYKVDDLVKIAKREKNKKRSYLFVNPLQGKHIPADPVKVDSLCAYLASIIDTEFKEKKKYVVGFAETATGISAAVCQHMSNVVFFEHTTREYSRKNEYIFFTESHSHAKEQLLDKCGLEVAVEEAGVIILIDDEITTGNTVCKLIDQLKDNYEYKGQFIIASLVNSMTDERIEELKDIGIECRYVLKIPHGYKAELAESIDEKENSDEQYSFESIALSYNTVKLKSNPRALVSWVDYRDDMLKFSEYIASDCGVQPDERVCIVGTEEFMYLTICLGEYLLDKNYARSVRIHSTTRSPIVPSSQEGYPLNTRYKLNSFYSEKRTTYIYNIDKYDRVIVVTDGSCKGKGIQSLLSALCFAGNDTISVYRCRYEK